MNVQVGVPPLGLAKDLRHRVVAGVDDPDPQAGRRPGGVPRHRRRPVHLSEDLARLDQERGTSLGQPHVVGGALQQAHPKLPFQPLQLLAQRRLNDVFPGGRVAEVQLLGQSHEVAQLAQLHIPPPPAIRPRWTSTRLPSRYLKSPPGTGQTTEQAAIGARDKPCAN